MTGSPHCALAPYCAKRLGRRRLIAHRVSARGVELDCEVEGARVLRIGRAVTSLGGVIDV